MAVDTPLSVPDFVCCTELGALLEAASAVPGHEQSTTHLGSNILQHERAAGLFPAAGAVIARIGKLLCGSRWEIEHCDLVHRSPGTPMDWHTDSASFPTRERTAIIALNTLPDGQSCVKVAGAERCYPHEAGRLLFFPAALEHCCKASAADRYALIYWLRRAGVR